MRRLISLLLAFAAVWLGLASPADAFSSPATSVQAYAYAGHHRISETNVATPERGPPSSYGRGTHYDAVDDWSNGASARPNVPTPGSNYAYNDPGTLVRVARVTPTTQERVWVPDGGSGVFTKAGVAAKGADEAFSAGRYLNDSWYKSTFPNRTQSVQYHLAQHGKGRTAVEYTRDAMDFFAQNQSLGKAVILRDGTAGIKIATKQPLPGGGVQKVGGYWTSDGRLVTFWD